MPSKAAPVRDDTVIAEEVLRTYCPTALQEEYASITDPTWKSSFVKNFLESIGGLFSCQIHADAIDEVNSGATGRAASSFASNSGTRRMVKPGDPHWVLAEALSAGTASNAGTNGGQGLKPDKQMIGRLAAALPNFGADYAHGGGITGTSSLPLSSELRTLQAMFGGIFGAQSRSQQIVQQHEHFLTRQSMMVEQDQKNGKAFMASCCSGVKKGRADLLLDDVGAAMHPSDFAALRSIGWKDLKTFTVMSGCVLKGTIVTEPVVQVACQTVLEDTDGECVQVSFYNVLPDHLPIAEKIEEASRKFGKGCKVAIANPFYKVALDGSRMVRVDDPRDILVEKLPLRERARQAVRTLAELKADGNKLVAQQKYEEAAVAYKSCFSEECGQARDAAVTVAELLLSQVAGAGGGEDGGKGSCTKPVDALRNAAAARILCGGVYNASLGGEKENAEGRHTAGPTKEQKVAALARENYASELGNLGYEELSKRASGLSKDDVLLCDEVGPDTVVEQHQDILLLCSTAAMTSTRTGLKTTDRATSAISSVGITSSTTSTPPPDAVFDVAAVLSNLGYVLLRTDDPLSAHAYSLAALAVTELLPTTDARVESLRRKIALRLVEALVSLGEVDAARAAVEAFVTDIDVKQASGQLDAEEAESVRCGIRRFVDPKHNILLLLPGTSAEKKKADRARGLEATREERVLKLKQVDQRLTAHCIDALTKEREKGNSQKRRTHGRSCTTDKKPSQETGAEQDDAAFLVPFEWVHPAIETRFLNATKGRGLIALEDIAKETPLLVVKIGSLAAASSAAQARDCLVDVERSRIIAKSQRLLRGKVTRLATSNPAVAWRLHHLVTDDFSRFYDTVKSTTHARLCEFVCDRLSPVVLPCLPPGRDTLVDGLEVFARKVWNQFTARKIEAMLDINIHGLECATDDGSVLFPSISLMNHNDKANTCPSAVTSCDPFSLSGTMGSRSATRKEDAYKKVTVTVAAEDIAKGEEITTSYSSDRDALRVKWGISTPSGSTKNSASKKPKKQK